MSVSRKAKMAHLSIANRRLERLASEQGILISELLRERDEAREEALRWYQQCLEARAECTTLNQVIDEAYTIWPSKVMELESELERAKNKFMLVGICPDCYTLYDAIKGHRCRGYTGWRP